MKPVDYVLKFNGDFYNPIIDSVKKSTIRDESKPLNIGDFVFAHFLPDNVCIVRIDNHYSKKLKDLNEIEAKNKGYMHPDILRHELKNIYPNITDDDYLYIYEFTYIKHEKRLCNEFLKGLSKENLL